MASEKRIAEIVDLVMKNADLVRVTKAELVAVIKFQANVKLPVATDDKLFTVNCAKQACKNKARLPRSQAAGWRCENHK